MEREYWTYLDNSNNHYEISNFGRIRNAHTQVIKKCYLRKDGNLVFDIHYKDTPYKRITIKREVFKHFSDSLKRTEFVTLIDSKKLPSIDNLSIYSWENIERKKKQKKVKKQNTDVWSKCQNTCKIIVLKNWIKCCNSYGIEIDDLIQEATLNVISDYDSYKENISFWKFCNYRILKSFNTLKNTNESFDKYVIGKNYDDF